MREYHPDPRALERFVRGLVSRQEVKLVVRHLLTRCPRCLAIVQDLAGPGWVRGHRDAIPEGAGRRKE